MSDIEDLPTLLSAAQVAAILGTSREWVYAAANAGKLEHFRFGGHRRFDLQDLLAYIDRSRASGCRQAKSIRPPSSLTLPRHFNLERLKKAWEQPQDTSEHTPVRKRTTS
ncbi:MAG: helix-turn-helix domain-containing protein [Planctomycetales bacterium]|nr:helix-turn-helix domain-containing protein [Planctomycetales bacterium]